jgi:Zn-dependent protease/predicted transcriptional regulator
MNRQTISLGHILGIPLGIDYSWFLIFGLLTWTLATGYYPSEFKTWPVAQYWVVAAVTAILFFGSVLLHELGHSVVAQRYHIPVSSIRLLIFGGVSELNEEPTSAISSFFIAITGPLINLVLAGIFALLSLVVSGFEPLLALVKYLATINLLLGLFNLIPGFPLDGGNVLMSIVWGITHNKHRAILIAASSGSFFSYVFIFLGTYQILGGNLMNGVWTAFIGWFLLNASGGQVRRERLKELLAGHKASEAMNRSFTMVQADTPIQTLVDEHILGSSRRSFIVKQGDAMIGLMTMHPLQDIPKEKWLTTTAGEAMVPAVSLIQINSTTGLWEAMEEMDRDGVNQLPVMEDGQVQGMLTREDVISYLRKLSEKGK